MGTWKHPSEVSFLTQTVVVESLTSGSIASWSSTPGRLVVCVQKSMRRVCEGLGFTRGSTVSLGLRFVLLRVSAASPSCTLAGCIEHSGNTEPLAEEIGPASCPLCQITMHCHTSYDMLTEAGPVLSKMWRLPEMERCLVHWRAVCQQGSMCS